VSQRAALACFLPQTIAILEERRAQFQARRDFLVPALRELGFAIPVMPSGGFFVYADSSGLADDSEVFCRDVLQGAGVALTPGVDFGRHRPESHVRFSNTIGRHKLEEGVERLARYVKGQRER
jgi:aspartate/methionine/tyrosine aminotransferase